MEECKEVLEALVLWLFSEGILDGLLGEEIEGLVPQFLEAVGGE